MIGALAIAVAAPAFAGPKDQTKDSLIGTQSLAGNATVNNDTTAFSMASKGCKVQIKAKGLTGTTDGDIIICVAGADVIAPPALNAPGAGNGIVMLGEVKKGGLGIKADLTEVGCGGANQINFNGTLNCYLDDPAYRTPAGTWSTLCAGQGMLAVANAQPDPATLKVSGENVIVGLCQGISLGQRLPGPASALIAARGARGFVE
ncbi:MAG: hypothetical protein SF182_21025 [Deltaproteobacteria bacterium]|nr:hypothetical protein [Deltaproteobacteria bacterium]